MPGAAGAGRAMPMDGLRPFDVVVASTSRQHFTCSNLVSGCISLNSRRAACWCRCGQSYLYLDDSCLRAFGEQFVASRRTVLETWMGCALGNQVCRFGLSVSNLELVATPSLRFIVSKPLRGASPSAPSVARVGRITVKHWRRAAGSPLGLDVYGDVGL